MKQMTLDEAKRDLEKFVKLKTTLRPAFVDVLLNAEEVVRCKDCRCAKKMECVFIPGNEQGITLHCLMHESFVDDDDFCSWGERREDETN